MKQNCLKRGVNYGNSVTLENVPLYEKSAKKPQQHINIFINTYKKHLYH